MKKVVILLIMAVALFSCDNHRKTHKEPKSIKVKCYKQHNTTANDDPADDWVF